MRAKCGLLGHQHQRWGRVSQEGGSTSSCSPLPANVPLAKRSLELEAVMKDASVEHGERERCNEHPTVPQSADSSISNSNECSTEPWEISGCVQDSFWKSRNRRLPSRWTSNASFDVVGSTKLVVAPKAENWWKIRSRFF